MTLELFALEINTSAFLLLNVLNARLIVSSARLLQNAKLVQSIMLSQTEHANHVLLEHFTT